MFDKIKKSLECKKLNIEIENYYEKIGWEINKYFVLIAKPPKKELVLAKHQNQIINTGLKIIILLNELVNKMPPYFFDMNEISFQYKSIHAIKIDQKNISLNLVIEVLIRYYVLLPYLYVCQCSNDYIKHHKNISVNLLIKTLTKKDINKIVSKSPNILKIWNAIQNDSELHNKFPSDFDEIFLNYIKF